MRVLIAYVYNNNGIATWCYEAARAILPHAKWCKIVTHHAITVPTDLKEICIPYNPWPNGRGVLVKISEKLMHWLQWLLPVNPNAKILEHAIKILEQNAEKPDIILVCQPNFLAPRLSIPQWVVARTFPSEFIGYVSQLSFPSDMSTLKRVLFLWYWYRMDNKGYRLSGKVLTLSDALANNLIKKGIDAKRVYPGVSNKATVISHDQSQSIQVISACLNLEEKRKNIIWLVTALEKSIIKNISVHLTLSGAYSSNFENILKKIYSSPTNLTGFLRRDELLQLFSQQHLFLFSSYQENWGYVLVEAMSAGCAIFAPDQYPFNEIVGRSDFLYKPRDYDDFSLKLQKILADKEQLYVARCWFYQRYLQLFSNQAFALQLKNAIGFTKD